MCTECGCGLPSGENGAGDASDHDHSHLVEVAADLLENNNRRAAHNRRHFDRHGVLAVNLMSSPGAGKTSLLEATIDAIGDRFRIAVVEGDLETENDADRIRARGVPAVQITTGTACHLDAALVHDALHQLDLSSLDILFIENVGNLVCPASFDLGQHANVALLSVPEGDDKPAKYPVMFRAADLVCLTKIVFLPLCPDFCADRVRARVEALANPAPVLPVTVKHRESLVGWLAWLEQAREALARRRPLARTDSHSHSRGHP